ncbi:MAG: amino acid adenylation domain-containing protein, partial [Bacteroidota bacterium]
MNQTGKREVRYGANQCIHTLFELQVESTPDAPALVYRQTILTYRQLDQKANQLAHFLQKKGVGPEVLVAISLERSLEMIIGLLGVLKAGGAYLPLDPTSPKDRLRWMLEDASISILLTQDHLVEQMPVVEELEIIALDKDWELIEQEPSIPVQTAVQAHHLIYTIYTSGSTGRPKGVQIEHRNVCNLIAGQINYVQHPVGRFLYAYSFAFDGAVLLIYWTLLDGGTLVMAEEGLEKDIHQLSHFIAEQQITHLLTFASLYSILLDKGERKDLQSLESVSVAGEACPPMLVKNHHRLLTGVKLLNQYGPTEATVGASIYLTPEDFTGEKVPIGKAIDGVKIYILNEKLEQVSLGAIGEIFIGGKGVARAYLNRPDLTQQKFLINPFGKRESDRLYCTGDLGRWLPDGNIDFMGRADHQ